MNNNIHLEVEEATNICTTSYKDYVINADKAMIKYDDVFALLSKSYWASARSKEHIMKSIENSLCFGVYYKEKQIGFARIVTDYVTHAYLCDVIVNEEYRGQGIGKALMTFIMEYPSLQDVKTICLLTNDAHKLYEKYGFLNMEDPRKFMISRRKGN